MIFQSIVFILSFIIAAAVVNKVQRLWMKLMSSDFCFDCIRVWTLAHKATWDRHLVRDAEFINDREIIRTIRTVGCGSYALYFMVVDIRRR